MTAEGTHAAPAERTPAHIAVLSPADEAARAIEETHRLLAEAAEAVASDEADRLAHAYELAAGCADHIARALWFLRRAEREQPQPAQS